MKSLCRLDEISDPGGKGFTFGDGAARREIFVVRRGAQVFGYLNRCPHAGVPLDWTPDQFLDLSKTMIQCATHGALFSIESGACIAGPCRGQRLVALQIQLASGNPADNPESPAVLWDDDLLR